MGIFNFFQTGILLKAVESFESKIIDSEAYLYFNRNKAEDDTLPLAEDGTYLLELYKKFEVTIIATAIVAILFEIDLKNSKDRDVLRTIYLGKSADFMRLLLSGKLVVNDLKVSHRDKNMLIPLLNLKIGAKFENYYKELKESINNQSIYSYWKYETPKQRWDPTYKVFTEEIIEGEDRLFSFLWNLFLCYESIDYEIFDYDQKRISYKVFLYLNEDELYLMKKFILEIKDYKNK